LFKLGNNKTQTLFVKQLNKLCSRFSGISPLIGFEPSIFELSTFIRGKGKSE